MYVHLKATFAICEITKTGWEENNFLKILSSQISIVEIHRFLEFLALKNGIIR